MESSLKEASLKQVLAEKGYAIITSILSQEEIETAREMFLDWKKDISDELHAKIDPHGIYKHQEAGHQRHAWYLRTHPGVKKVFEELWETTDLIVSYDGSCWIPKTWDKKDKCWTHTDQCANNHGLECYQGFVSLTDNKERTLIVYEGSHLLHERYFADRNQTGTKNWEKIDPEYLAEIADRKRVLEIPAGSVVVWDSRTFHQNQYGAPKSEDRIVQYVCYLPRNHKKNTPAIQKKRQKYFEERRTTSHWPCPVHVNGLQPQTYGNSELMINYSELKPPDLSGLEEEIQKLI
jgi:hypothetical protein